MLLKMVLGMGTWEALHSQHLDPHKERKERGKGAENRAVFPCGSHEA